MQINIWNFQPSTYDTNPPRGIIRHERDGMSGTLEIVIKQPADEPPEQIKGAYEYTMKGVRFYIEKQCADLAAYGPGLRTHIASAIGSRRARVLKHDGLSALLGIPEMKPGQRNMPPSAAAPPARDATGGTVKQTESWDVFVSHASEDKESFARPLATALRAEGLRVWFDESTLTVGDGLRRSIDRGLAQSRFGVVVISKAFLGKEWPQRELDGLVAREEEGQKVVLPIWHAISAADVRRRSPTLADRLAVPSSKGIAAVVAEILRVVRPA